MSFLGKLLFGGGTLKPELKAELEAEGLVLLEEGLRGKLRYEHFKAPGKRFNGKVTPMKMAIGISEERLVMYGLAKTKVIDTAHSDPRTSKVSPRSDGETVRFTIDYDGDPEAIAAKVSGRIIASAKTPSADRIVDELRARKGGYDWGE